MLDLPRDVLARVQDALLRPVAVLLGDPDVTEVLINGPEEIWFERDGRLHHFPGRFPSRAALLALARHLAQAVDRPLGPDSPRLSARLAGGARVQLQMPPVAPEVSLAIRLFRERCFTLDELVGGGALQAAQAEALRRAVRGRRNIVVSGGTGSGKTSLLAALAAEVPAGERLVIIEDTREIRLARPNLVPLEAVPGSAGREPVTLRDLFLDALRLRPDRIVVGEVRGPEVLVMLEAMASGHAGSLTTLHADSPQAAVARLELLAVQAGLPPDLARRQVQFAVHDVVQVERRADGRRVVSAHTTFRPDPA